MGQPNSVGLGDQPEQTAIGREAPGPARSDNFQGGFAAKGARTKANRLQAAPFGLAAPKPIILKSPLIEIIDGDTVTIKAGSHEYRIRLHGIDCPESDQPFGDQAAETLAHLVDPDEVECRLTGADRYGRLVGVLSVDGKSVNLELVEAGLAWWYEQYAPDDEKLAEAENEVRAVKRGLWVDSEAVAPWEWRKRN